MATKFNVPGRIVKNADREFNGSEARKFFVPPSDFADPVGDPTSNFSFFVQNAAGLRSLAIVAASAAAAARSQVQAVRNSVLDTTSNGPADVPPPLRDFSDTDVSHAQDIFAVDVVSGISGFSDSTLGRLTRVARGVVNSSGLSFLPKIERPDSLTGQGLSAPRIDHIVVDMDKKKGTVDAFFATIKFSLPLADVVSGKTKVVRVMRASITDPTLLRRVSFLSFRGLETLRADDNRSRTKNIDYLSSIEKTTDESGVGSALSILNPIDPVTGLRTSADLKGKSLSRLAVSGTPPSPAVLDDLSSFVDPDKFGGMDRSVARDLKTMQNIVIQDGPLTVDTSAVQQGGKKIVLDNGVGVVQTRALQNGDFSDDGIVRVENNAQEFQEVALFTPRVPASPKFKMGDFAEYSFDDPSIIYGRVYRYFIVTIDKDGKPGMRSRIVEVTVDGLRVPARPSNVRAGVINGFVSLVIDVDDQLVEKFEVYRRETETGSKFDSEFSVISGPEGFSVEDTKQEPLKNGFSQVGEVMAGIRSGATFYDRAVVVGRKYTYRVYSVDIFGNKSESPFETTIFVPDRSLKQVDLLKPVMLSEVDAFTRQVKLTFHCDDPRVVWLFLGRRDLTLKQPEFTPPHQVNNIRLGSGPVFVDGAGTQQSAQGPTRFEDNHFDPGSRDTWNGVFRNQQTGSLTVFVDRTTRVDHTYQYRLYGVDVFGNKTSAEITPPIFVFNQPLLSSPVSFSGSVEVDSSGLIRGVRMRWLDSNINFSPEDQVGSQDALADTAVRSLFQLQRRRVGEEKWFDFPLVSGDSFFDPTEILSGSSPNYRPSYLKVGETYLYRIQAFQTGNFISNFTHPVEVFVGQSVLAPVNFRARPSDPNVKPISVMLSWDTDPSSGIVDKWQIERVVVNNFAADRLNVRNPSDFSKLEFSPFREVFRESSRFRSRVLDGGAPFFLSSDHAFMDTDVKLGNTYFYRIRAVDVDGSSSSWVYKGAKMTEETFEQKVTHILDTSETSNFSDSFSSMNIKGDVFEPNIYGVHRSLSFIPEFSNPSTILEPTKAAEPVPADVDLVGLGRRKF